MDVFNLPSDPNANPDLDDDYRALIQKQNPSTGQLPDGIERTRQEQTVLQGAIDAVIPKSIQRGVDREILQPIHQEIYQPLKAGVQGLGRRLRRRSVVPAQAIIQQNSPKRGQPAAQVRSPVHVTVEPPGEKRRQQLFKAAAGDDVDTCRAIFDKIGTIHNLNNDEWEEPNSQKNALHVAMEEYSKKVIWYLIHDKCSRDMVITPYKTNIDNRAIKQTSLHALVQNADLSDPERLPMVCRLLSLTKTGVFRRGNLAFMDAFTLRKMEGVDGKLHHFSALHIAAFRGDTEMVEMLIREGATLDNNHAQGATPLFYAIRSGHQQTTEKIVFLKAKVNYVTANGSTALYWAVRYERVDLVKFLLRKGAELAPTRPRGFGLPLILAAALGNEEIVDIFLAKKVDRNSQNRKKETALHFVAALGHTHIIETLTRGVIWQYDCLDVNLPDKFGHTALMFAVKGGHIQAMKQLLLLGADITLRNNQQQSVWQFALAHEDQLRREIIAELVESYIAKYYLNNTSSLNFDINKGNVNASLNVAGSQITMGTTGVSCRQNALEVCICPLNETAIKDNPDLIHELIGLGIAQAECDERGENFLHVAVRGNCLNILETFVPDATPEMLNKYNIDGDTPLHLAAKHERPEAAQILINNEKVDQLAMNLVSLRSALSVAVRSTPEVTSVLLSNRHLILSHSEELDETGNTYLHLGALMGNLEVLEAFIDVADIDERNSQGDTALHTAIWFNQIDAIYFLMEHKASLGIKDHYGRTPLHITASVKQLPFKVTEDMVNAIKESGNVSLLDERDNLGKTPLHLAARKGKVKIVEPLECLDPSIIDENGNTALHEAAIRNNPEFIKEMLAVFRDHDSFHIDQENHKHETVLHICANTGDVRSVRMLMQEGANVLAKNYYGDTILHSLVAETVIEPRKTELMANVYDVIVEESVTWWCKTKQIEIPDQSSSSYGHFKRFVVLELTACTLNEEGMSVVAFATALGAARMLEKILNTPKVYCFSLNKSNHGEILYDYDVTDLTPSADPARIRSNDRSFSDNFYSDIEGIGSCLDILATNGDNLTAAHILEITPIKQLVQNYWAAYQWIYGFMMLIHVTYMALFTIFSFRVLPAAETNTKYWAFLIWPGCLLVFEIYYAIANVAAWCQSRKRRKVTRKSPEEMIGPFSRLNKVAKWIIELALTTFDNLPHVAAIVFCIFVATWYVLHLLSNRNQVYVVVVALIIGWLYATSFTKGFKSVHAFNVMLKYIIVRDMTRFTFVYLFILLAFGFALHALFIADPSYKGSVWDTLFMTFNMMLGMGELFLTDDFNTNYTAAGLDPTVPKIVYLIYIILATIVFLNLLIAMMTDTYANVQENEARTWQISTVTLAVRIERKMAFLRRFLSYIKALDARLRLVEIKSPDKSYLQEDTKLYRCISTLTLEQIHQSMPNEEERAIQRLENKLDVLTKSHEQLAEKVNRLTHTDQTNSTPRSARGRRHKSSSRKDVSPPTAGNESTA